MRARTHDALARTRQADDCIRSNRDRYLEDNLVALTCVADPDDAAHGLCRQLERVDALDELRLDEKARVARLDRLHAGQGLPHPRREWAAEPDVV